MSAPEAAGRGRRAPPGDLILRTTRWTAVAIIPFLVVAAFLLLAFPSRSGELFAWQIDAPLSAALLAAAYIGGIRFFVAVALAPRWHLVEHGFPAVVLFSGALLVATLIHLERFSSNLSFAVWMALYAVTPFLIAAVAVAQRRRDPRSPDPADVTIPRAARGLLVAIGGTALITGTVLFAAPALVIPVWAWELTPLTARVLGAVLSLTGVVNVAMLWDPRWSAFRILYQAQLLSLAVIAASLVAYRDDLRWDTPITPLFLGLIGGALIGYAAFTVWCEVRRARADAAARVQPPARTTSAS